MFAVALAFQGDCMFFAELFRGLVVELQDQGMLSEILFAKSEAGARE